MSYFHTRQNPLECPIEEIEDAFAKIVNYFDEAWLTTEDGTHVLQLLWKRRDALSTNELFTFGKSLIAAEKASPDWLKNQVKLVRGKNENNQKGAIFEILAVGYTASNQIVIPASANQPGYDLDIETKNGTSYRVSLKRYSQSSHEKLFRKKSAHAEVRFIEGLKKSRRNASLFIEAREYPSESDWQKLYLLVYQLASAFDGSTTVIDNFEDRWDVAVMPLNSERNEIFSVGQISHTFICVSAYHKNEQDNFLSKLEDAVSNLERHVQHDSGRLPMIFMQLPDTASANILATWAQEYLFANNSSILEAICFIQPYVTKNDSSSQITYFFSFASSMSFIKKEKEIMVFEMPVGSITSQPPEWSLQSFTEESQLIDKYIYQHGKHFILPSMGKDGSIVGEISMKAPGIESMAVINIQGQEMIFGGRWGHELCLLGG